MIGKYTIKEIELRTGVAAATLRQWERRYGFPRPHRSYGGYRLFSDEDVARILRMQAFVSSGVPPSRAAQLVRETASQQAIGKTLKEFADQLGEALRNHDTARAERTLSEAYALHPIDDVLLGVVTSAMIEIGDLWHAGEVSVATEHFATQLIQSRLRLLLTMMPRATGAACVLVACAPDELHEVGALMVAVLLSRQGFDVTFLGQATPVEDLVAMVERTAADAVFISATLPVSLERLLESSSLLRSLKVPLVFGGRAFMQSPETAGQLGGMFLGNDLENIRAAITNGAGKARSR